MTKLSIHAVVDRGEDIEEFKKLVNRSIPTTFTVEERDLSNIPWDTFPVNGYEKTAISTKWWKPIAERIWKSAGYKVDALMCFVSIQNWRNTKEKPLWGMHYGTVYHSYEMSMTKLRRGYENTAWHELLHKLDDIIYTELGVRLEQIFDVEDFDDDVVHGRDARYVYTRYPQHNSQILDTIRPYLMKALEKRRMKGTLIGLLLNLISLLRAKIAQRQLKPEAIPETLPEQETTNRIVELAHAIKDFEVYAKPGETVRGIHFPNGSISYRNNNPGNLRWSYMQDGQKGGYAYFDTYGEGWEALLHQLRIAADGRSSVYNPEDTLWNEDDKKGFFNKYAPSSDNNHPKNYAEFVAKRLGVGLDYQIKNII